MELTLERIQERDWDRDGSLIVQLHTDAGMIRGRYHQAPPGSPGVLWVFGAGGGLGGPAGAMYIRLAKTLSAEGVASLRLDYRRPGLLPACILDVSAGIYYLDAKKHPQAVLVGHSFGGAVVIEAGVRSGSVLGVAALSTQTAGAEAVAWLSPKPLLLMHGLRDEVLPHTGSESLFSRARQPKKLLTYNCRHGLDECREEIERDLLSWIREVVTVKRRAS